MIKPQTPKGFRDFLPTQARARQFVVGKVREVFELFGFEPLETPTIEYASVILGKYGEEADKLVFRFTDRGQRELALRYDQTVPTARVLAQYQNQLPRFFRRYQIQNVFRADKPQKGRFREFTQCDIDIFGSTSAVADAEIVACTYFAFRNVGYPTIILKINDRKILFDALTQFSRDGVPTLSIIQSIDKLDKLSESDIIKELMKKGLDGEDAKRALTVIREAKQTQNLEAIIAASVALGVPEKAIQFEPTLARGLDYYTGMIFEVVLPEYELGSFGGGGRYDNLIKQLGGTDTPAVGIAFGFDRMVEAATALMLVPQATQNATILVTIFSDDTLTSSLTIARVLRKAGIATEVVPNTDKLDRQLKYADRKGIPYVVIQGPEEAAKCVVKLKDMKSKEQTEMTIDHVVQKFLAS